MYNKIITIDDQIRDEKLQYDINREAAKISTLSSGKIHKYEYLTGEDILPSNQQQIIEQAKFTYSPLGKAFEKQIKTIGDQEKKQVEALKDIKPKEQTKTIEGKSDDKLSMQKETYNRLLGERLNEIEEINKEAEFNNLTYYFKISGISPINFIQLDTIKNVKNLYDSRQKIVNLFNDSANIRSEAIYKTKQDGTGLKILTPKQMLQKLPIALAQVKAGNNSESLLNEIRQNVYSLYQSEEITK